MVIFSSASAAFPICCCFRRPFSQTFHTILVKFHKLTRRRRHQVVLLLMLIIYRKNKVFIYLQYFLKLGHQNGTLIWDTDLGHYFGTPIWDTNLGHRFGTLFWDTDLGQYFGTPIWGH
jgi:hypothetical protein